jgi:hypothetical protein
LHGGAWNERDTIWPLWVIGIAVVAITAALGIWACSL